MEINKENLTWFVGVAFLVLVLSALFNAPLLGKSSLVIIGFGGTWITLNIIKEKYKKFKKRR